MKAIVRHRYGPPDVVALEDVDEPEVPDDGVLVRVRAAAVNPLDWHAMTGIPYIVRIGSGLRRPKQEVLGVDFAGTVESIGSAVTQFRPGGEVFGGRRGAFAEYVCVSEDGAGVVVGKPATLTFEQAAAVPVAALTALEGLRHKGQVQEGQEVLVNGASGGVGTFAVQLAKSFGADVTGVCSTGKVDIARSLGADRVIDYTREDFTRDDRRYDLMLDIAGSRSWSEFKRVLAEEARVVVIGGPKTNRLLGPLSHLAGMKIASLGGSRKVIPFVAGMAKDDLLFLRELLEAGTVKPVIDRQYELSQAAEALRYLGEGHASGKIVLTV